MRLASPMARSSPEGAHCTSLISREPLNLFAENATKKAFAVIRFCGGRERCRCDEKDRDHQGRLAFAARPVALRDAGENGLQIMTVAQMATWLAGGFLHQVTGEHVGTDRDDLDLLARASPIMCSTDGKAAPQPSS